MAAIPPRGLGMCIAVSLLLCITAQAGLARAVSESIVVGVPESSPPEYVSNDAYSTTGFAVQFMEQIAEGADVSLITRRFSGWQDVLREVQQGTVQVVPLMPVLERYRKIVHYTAPVHSVTMRVFTRSSSSSVQGIEDLQGRKVAVLSGDPGEAIARELNGLIIREATTVEQLLFMLLSGTVDAIIYPEPPIRYFLDRMGVGSRVAMLPDRLLEVQYALAVHVGQEALFARLDEQVRAFVQTKPFRNLVAHWYDPGTREEPLIVPDWGHLLAVLAGLVFGVSVMLLLRREASRTEQLVSVLDGLGYPALVATPDGNVLAYNTSAANHFDLVGLRSVRPHLSSLFEEEAVERRLRSFERVASSHEPIESLHEEEDRLYRLIMTPVALNRSGKSHVMIMLRDITDRNQLETRLQTMGRDYALIFDHAPEGIALMRQNMTIEQVNPALARFVGYGQEELGGMALRDLLYPDDAEEIRLALHRLLIGEVTSVRVEKRFLHRSGVPLWGALCVVMQRTDLGIINQIVAYVTDVHDRRTTELRMRESEMRYREIFERASDLIMLVNLSSGRVEEFNHAVVKALGYSVAELSTMHAADLETGDVHLFGTHVRELDDAELFECRLRRKDGSFMEAQVHTRVILAAGRQYALAVIRDVSGQKEAESSLRTAKQAAETSIRARDEFFGNISQELRTPLHGMLGVMQLLEQTTLDGTQRGYIRMAGETGTSLMRFLDDLLDFAGVESALAGGQMALEQASPFIVDDVLHTVINSFYCEATLKQAGLSAEISSVMPEMMVGVAPRLRQILFNLVGHALQFAAGGEVVVSLRQPPGGVLNRENALRMTEFALRVSADGAERWRDSVRRAFTYEGLESFEDSRTFGLVLSRRLADLLHGSIYVQDEGQLEVVMRLPLRWTPAEPDSALVRTLVAEAVAMSEQAWARGGDVFTAPEDGVGPAPAAAGSGGAAAESEPGKVVRTRTDEQPLFEGVRIIVADDDSINRMVVGRWLELHGCMVTYVENGQQVLEALATGRYDGIIMDLQMPEMNGIEAAAAIRASRAGEAARHIPILALTALAMQESRDASLDAGMDGFLSKPVDMSRLSSELLKLLAHEEGGASLPDGLGAGNMRIN